MVLKQTPCLAVAYICIGLAYTTLPKPDHLVSALLGMCGHSSESELLSPVYSGNTSQESSVEVYLPSSVVLFLRDR